MQITEFKYDCFDPILPLLGEKSSKIESGIYYYHADHLGSSSVVTDKNGKFHEHLEYFPYGETWINDRANNENLPYRFTGKELDPETGLYYYGARYYDAKLSRWISADPPLASGEYLPNGNKKHDANLPGMGGVFNSINLDAYQYCGQNPVKYVDPDGLKVRLYNETVGTGHTFISVGEGENLVVYTYGRYAALYYESSGRYCPSGEGVLIKLEGDDARKYIEWEMERNNIDIYEVGCVKDENVNKYFECLLNGSRKYPTEGRYKNKNNAKVVNDYNILSSNCTIVSLDALKWSYDGEFEFGLKAISPGALKRILTRQPWWARLYQIDSVSYDKFKADMGWY